jgi:hypothetical protein
LLFYLSCAKNPARYQLDKHVNPEKVFRSLGKNPARIEACDVIALSVCLDMRYLVKARVKAGREAELLRAVADGSLGRGSVAGDEYIYDLQHARVGADGVAHWVETCFCATPLAEERPYWERFFELLSVKDAHNRKNCRHENGTEHWACCNCDCTKRLEERLQHQGKPFLSLLIHVA